MIGDVVKKCLLGFRLDSAFCGEAQPKDSILSRVLYKHVGNRSGRPNRLGGSRKVTNDNFIGVNRARGGTLITVRYIPSAILAHERQGGESTMANQL